MALKRRPNNIVPVFQLREVLRLKNQPSGKRCNKGRDIHLRQESGDKPCQNSERQHKR